MPIRWNVAALMEAHGIANPNQLAERLNLTLPLAYRLVDGRDLERIDAKTVELLCRELGAEPTDLFAFSPPLKKKGRGRR